MCLGLLDWTSSLNSSFCAENFSSLIGSETVIGPSSGIGKPAVMSTGPVCASADLSLSLLSRRDLLVAKARRVDREVEQGAGNRGRNARVEL